MSNIELADKIEQARAIIRAIRAEAAPAAAIAALTEIGSEAFDRITVLRETVARRAAEQ